MKSTEFLQAAIDVQAERGKQYDKPTGERSMAATVIAFNCITGSMLEESDGWMFLGLLKLVRQSQNPEQYHHDSALDFVAYASLYAEAASEQCGQAEQDAHIGYKEEEPSHIISDIPEDPNDRLQWKIGDIFEITGGGYEFHPGERVRLINDMTKERIPCCEYLDGRDYWWVSTDVMKFVSRPTSTAK